ncbi:zinc-dependent alcohol dehydrogenase family protein [Streptomyces sp. NPDC056160]|uniref:zinc-dependent alcohol dehydrogenase family protein n=1 Tax=Streptomyces sp. NPDC056160 TaxID=3345731 RepID=UPI0035D8E647
MRALAFKEYGDPARVLDMTELPRPEPGPDQVRVRLAARPINPSDLLFVQGAYGREASFTSHPDGRAEGSGWAVAGFEGAGTVEALGAGTRGPVPGTRVAVSASGTWQEEVCVPGSSVLPLPNDVSTDVACQFTVNPFTAVLLLREVALEPGDTLLLTAGASAVSRMTVHLARRRGLRCLPVVRRREQARVLARTGAEPVLVSSARTLVETVLDTTGRHRVGAVLDAVGGAIGGAALRCLRPAGQFISYGMLSGSPLQVTPDDLVFHQVTMRGFWLPARMERLDAQELRHLTREVEATVARGLPGLEVAERYDLADFPAALGHVRRAGRSGRVVLTG